MRVTLRLFAGPREAVGERDVLLDLPDGATVADALDALVARHPALARWRGSALVSVNREFASPDAAVADGDEVAFMPPVSGGAPEAPRAGLRDGALSVDEALALLARDGAGAAVAFLGIVRRTPSTLAGPDAVVEKLEFEAYEAMAVRELDAVRERAIRKFRLVDAVVWHRLGTLGTGEDVVLVAVTAAHRREAFEAAAYIMDELKSTVPVWKKEIGPAGAAWVNDPPEGPR